jgi:hypothetical protein
MPGKEGLQARERESNGPYCKAASYESDKTALQAYAQLQTRIFGADCDLSVYRIRYADVPHVVALGAQPPPKMDGEIEAILAGGTAAQLPTEVIQTLVQRRAQARRMGPWVEGHYRPGRRM